MRLARSFDASALIQSVQQLQRRVQDRISGDTKSGSEDSSIYEDAPAWNGVRNHRVCEWSALLTVAF